LVLRQVETPVQRGDEGNRLAGEQRKRIVVQVKMHEIEIGRAPMHALEHHYVQGVRVAHRFIVAYRPRPRSVELRLGARVAACEQRHLVTERNQFVGEPVDDALRAAIELRRNRLGERSDLGDVRVVQAPVSPAPRRWRFLKARNRDPVAHVASHIFRRCRNLLRRHASRPLQAEQGDAGRLRCFVLRRNN
jgi:hypothetical protein